MQKLHVCCISEFSAIGVMFKGEIMFKKVLYLITLIIINYSYIFSTATNIDNFHTVEANACYRCKQLSPEELEKRIVEHEIKTVINLRSEIKVKELRAEQKICEKLGVKFVHIPLKARKLPTKKNIQMFFDTLKSAPKPFLIHCLIGRDRSGMFCGLYELKCKNKSLDEALQQLSFEKFGHKTKKFPAMAKFLKIWSQLCQKYSQEEALEKYNGKKTKI